jgi:hypothetical protein
MHNFEKRILTEYDGDLSILYSTDYKIFAIAKYPRDEPDKNEYTILNFDHRLSGEIPSYVKWPIVNNIENRLYNSTGKEAKWVDLSKLITFTSVDVAWSLARLEFEIEHNHNRYCSKAQIVFKSDLAESLLKLINKIKKLKTVINKQNIKVLSRIIDEDYLIKYNFKTPNLIDKIYLGYDADESIANKDIEDIVNLLIQYCKPPSNMHSGTRYPNYEIGLVRFEFNTARFPANLINIKLIFLGNDLGFLVDHGHVSSYYTRTQKNVFAYLKQSGELNTLSQDINYSIIKNL